MYEPMQKPATSRKTLVIIIAAVMVFLLLVAGMIAGIFALTFSLLDNQKDSEEYKIAYSYLISSDAFQELGAEDGKIFFNSYSGSTVNGESSVTLGFLVKGHSLEVVCHKENGKWQVCRECTLFE